jgi:hypothetical protein
MLWKKDIFSSIQTKRPISAKKPLESPCFTAHKKGLSNRDLKGLSRWYNNRLSV